MSIGADSAARFVDLGRRASRHTHHVELAGRQPPADRSLCCGTTLLIAPRRMPYRLRHHRCCRYVGYTHAHPQQRQAAR